MTIILSGGGDPEVVVPIDKYFASIIDLQKTVLYIPNAMEPHVFSYEECYEWFKKTYGEYGVLNVELCIDLRTLNLDGRYSAVFIGGGNTFKLLNEIQKSNFDVQIHSYLETGGVLYGGSAGAIVCGKTIETAIYADENYVGINNLSGLNLLNNYDVFCHYDPIKHDSFISKQNHNLYLLFEESGLIINDSGFFSLGKPFVKKTTLF